MSFYYFARCSVDYIKTGAVFVCLFFCCLPAFSQVVPNRDEWLARDPRLKQEITVMRYHIRIGELLEEASRQSGVSLRANRLDGGDSEVITVYARKIALVDLLANVWSLMSYQQAAWRWEVEGDGKKVPYSYKLIYPKNARELSLILNEEAKQFLEESIEASIAALDASPDEIASLEAKYPDVRLNRDPLELQKIKAFRSLANSQERQQLAQGKMEKTIPRSKWTKEAEQYVRAAIGSLKQGFEKAGMPYESPEPEALTLYFIDGLAGMVPKVAIRIGPSAAWAVGGTALTDNYWQAHLAKRWIMEGDALSDPSGGKAIKPEPGASKKKEQSRYTDALQEKFAAFHKSTGIPLFARGMENIALASFAGQTVTEFVQDLRGQQQNVKWRNGAVLITSVDWVRKSAESAERPIPWSVMDRFREAVASRPDYNCTVDEVVSLAHDLSSKELENLKENEELFPPNMFIPTRAFLAGIRRLQPILAPLARSQTVLNQVQTERGVRVRDLPQEMRDYIAAQLPDQTTSSTLYFRIRTYDIPAAQWKPRTKKQEVDGYAIPRYFYLELGIDEKYTPMDSLSWEMRRLPALNASRIQPEADMRTMPFDLGG